jgi:hypothetical protein
MKKMLLNMTISAKATSHKSVPKFQTTTKLMANNIPRILCWPLATALLYFALNLYWSTSSSSSSSCTKSTPLLLLSFLFLQRGCIEIYRKFYSLSSSSSSRKLFHGRSALWIRLALSLALLVTVFFSVIESASTVFELEGKVQEQSWFGTTKKSGKNPNRPNDVHIKNSIAHQQQQALNDEEDEAARRIYNRHSTPVDADRNTFDKLAKNQKNLQQHHQAFSPGAGVPSYNHLLQDIEEKDRKSVEAALCPISTSFVSAIILWAIHSCAIGFLSWDAKKNHHQQRQQDDCTICWALHFDTINEIKLAANIVICNFLVNWASHSWRLDPVEEVPSYHNFVAGVWILYFEFNFSCLPALRALTLSLSDREVLLVQALEKALREKEKKSGDDNAAVDLKAIRAAKTHLGTLRLEVDIEISGEKEHQRDSYKTQILEVIKTSQFWERAFDLEDIVVNNLRVQ